MDVKIKYAPLKLQWMSRCIKGHQSQDIIIQCQDEYTLWNWYVWSFKTAMNVKIGCNVKINIRNEIYKHAPSNCNGCQDEIQQDLNVKIDIFYEIYTHSSLKLQWMSR